MKDKKKIVVLSILIIGLFLILGVSYAVTKLTFSGTRRVTIESNGLTLFLDESKTTQNIKIESSYPVKDEVGMKNEDYSFSLINRSGVPMKYTIYIVEDEVENKTPANFIRYFYSRDVKDIQVTRNMTENVDSTGRYILESDVIENNVTYNYTYKMWLDYNADNTVMNTNYSVHLKIDSRNYVKYTESILNGCDPVLSDNLIPVTIDSTGTVRKADTTEEWYNYEKQEWANAIIPLNKNVTYNEGNIIPEENIESYFVWIPRYKYKIFNEGNYTEVTSIDENAPQTIEIEFQSKSDPVFNGNTKDSWLTHPAFTSFDSNGFWVGKFESGYKGATTTEEAQANSSDSTKLQIKPNVYSWRYITVGNAFKVSYDYNRNLDSHMMKNTEWGAVAYLQHSTYGSHDSVRTNNNNSYLTGYAAVEEPTLGYNTNSISIEGNLNGTTPDVTQAYNTTTGYLASTTGNISGIYDMSGGTLEYVMGYNTNASTVGGESGITSLYSDFFTNSKWNKYYDKYFNATETDTTYDKRILGDATGEMGPFGMITDPDKITRRRASWYGDVAYFVFPAAPWFLRGGLWYGGNCSGIFTFDRLQGNLSTAYSFRVVLTP